MSFIQLLRNNIIIKSAYSVNATFSYNKGLSSPVSLSSLWDKKNWTFKPKLIKNGVIQHRDFKAECSRGGVFPISGGVWEERKKFWRCLWRKKKEFWRCLGRKGKKKYILAGFNNSDSSSELLREITSRKEKEKVEQVRQAKAVN